MNGYKNIINIGKEPVKPHFFHKKIAWRVYVWKAILPNVLIEEIDILQKLILSLANINELRDNSIVYQLGISKELLKSVKELCINSGYIDKEDNITPSGKKLFERSSSIEQGMLMNFKQIYIFRDSLTGDIIPNFKIDELPTTQKVHCDYVFKGQPNYKNLKPTFVDIGIALETRMKINSIADTIQHDYSNEDIEAEQFNQLSDMNLFSGEVDWELINDDGDIEIDGSDAEVENSSSEKIELTSNTTIKIISGKPEVLYLAADLYLDPDLPERIGVSSPFGHFEDSWFTNHMLMNCKKSENLQESLEFFKMEALEYFKDNYPFNNDLNIQLFNKYPAIANYDAWKPLKNQIEATTRAYNRLIQGHEDYDTFYLRAQRTLEGILSYCIDSIPNKKEIMKSVTKYNFIDCLKGISEELRIEIPPNYGPSFYNRLREVANNKGISSKDRALFLAFDASYHEQKTPSLRLFKNIPNFYRRINMITDARNKTAHFSEDVSKHLGEYEDIKRELDFLLDELILHYLITGESTAWVKE